MRENFLTNEVATMLKTLSPDEARALLAKLKSDAIQAAKEEREQREAKRTARADPKKQKKYFKQFDSELKEIPRAYQKIREQLATATGWEPGMGDCQLHFQSKPIGSRCLWSANWQTSRGALIPDSYFPLERMTSTELLAEGKDAIHPGLPYHGVRRPDPNVIEELIVPIMETYEAGGINFLDRLKVALRRIRGSYSEFIAPFDVPADSFMVLVRPGWGSRAEILEAMEKLRSNRVPRR